MAAPTFLDKSTSREPGILSRDLRRLSGLAAIVLTLLSTGCVGPVQDKVAANFRTKWLADIAKQDTPYASVHDAASRNDFINNFVAVKDFQYRNYVAALRRGSSYGNLTADGSRLILDGLAATTGVAATKAGLAAASAGITGFTSTVKKDVLFDQALPNFIEKMDELRANKLADITLKMKMKYEDYSGSDAYLDVEDYGAQGLFDAALSALTAQTGQATAQAKSGLSTAKGDAVSAAATAATSNSAKVAQVRAAEIQGLNPRGHQKISDNEMNDLKQRRDELKNRKPDIQKFLGLLHLVDGFTNSTVPEKQQVYDEVAKVTVPSDPSRLVQADPGSLNFHYQASKNTVEQGDMMKALLDGVNRLGAKETPPVSR